jgi:sec-independent protein translocase protein TatA
LGEFAVGVESLWHWIIVAIVLLLMFGKGKIPEVMGDTARGIKAFRKAMAEDEPPGHFRPERDEERDSQSTSR